MPVIQKLSKRTTRNLEYTHVYVKVCINYNIFDTYRYHISRTKYVNVFTANDPIHSIHDLILSIDIYLLFSLHCCMRNKIIENYEKPRKLCDRLL